MNRKILLISPIIILIFVGIFLTIPKDIQEPEKSFKEDKIQGTITEKHQDNNMLVWDENRPLTWDDFKGEIPEGNSEILAYISMKFRINFANQFDVTQGCQYNIIVKSVDAVFNQTASWVDKQSDDFLDIEYNIHALNHEQKHFDLAEVYSREMEKKLSNEIQNTFWPCPESTTHDERQRKVVVETNFHMDPILVDLENEHSEMDDLYDAETRQGRDGKKQDIWNKKIENWLKSGLN